jgi:hypothetical protein
MTTLNDCLFFTKQDQSLLCVRLGFLLWGYFVGRIECFKKWRCVSWCLRSSQRLSKPDSWEETGTSTSIPRGLCASAQRGGVYKPLHWRLDLFIITLTPLYFEKRNQRVTLTAWLFQKPIHIKLCRRVVCLVRLNYFGQLECYEIIDPQHAMSALFQKPKCPWLMAEN